ncbi:hypothetical protein ACLB2K_049439 [Fragaria x ananassa]
MKRFVLLLFFWCSAFFVLLVVQADPSVSLSPMLEKEQQALYSTIQGFVGNWWNGSDLYPDPCGWTLIQKPAIWFITCDFRIFDFTSKGKVDLSNNMIEGKLPVELGRLKNLTLLDLGSNKISGWLVQSLEEMVSIKQLVMSNNPIGGSLIRIQWQNLHKLEILDLSSSFLRGHIPKSMAEMKRLRFLGLNNNKLSGTISPRLESLPCIGALYLYGNNFTREVKFSEGFYQKMGRRFGAWNNPNLCYHAESSSPKYVPHGVKPCQQETTISSDKFPNSKL